MTDSYILFGVLFTCAISLIQSLNKWVDFTPKGSGILGWIAYFIIYAILFLGISALFAWSLWWASKVL